MKSRFAVVLPAFVGAVVFLLAAVPACLDAAQQPAPAASQCVQCHTKLKTLIRLCWKIEASRPKQQASAETSGEG